MPTPIIESWTAGHHIYVHHVFHCTYVAGHARQLLVGRCISPVTTTTDRVMESLPSPARATVILATLIR